MNKMFVRNIILFFFSAVFFIQQNAFASTRYLQCPLANSIQIEKNTYTDFQDPYMWTPPYNIYFSLLHAPQQGNQVLGEVNSVEAEYVGSGYDLLCLYPSNATTTRITLPPYTGYIAYRVYSVKEGDCKAVGLGFECKN